MDGKTAEQMRIAAGALGRHHLSAMGEYPLPLGSLLILKKLPNPKQHDLLPMRMWQSSIWKQ
ncbi:MAG: hypothetical protein U0Z26_06975 [Anaerolineales bacterium]